jgi:hypothetical protein
LPPVKLPKRNMDIINKAIRAMQRRPKSVDMDDWIQHDPSVAGKNPYCGTAACLAGHIAIAATGRIGDKNFWSSNEPEADFYNPIKVGAWIRNSPYVGFIGDYINSQNIAGAILHLNHDNDKKVFIVEDWPEKFRKMYKGNNKAKAAIARLRHYLKTGE